MKTKRLTVFASGMGSNFKALHNAVLKREIPAQITALICDKPGAGVLQYAKDNNIPYILLSPEDFPEKAAYTLKLRGILETDQPDLIILAGYLRKIPDEIVADYPRRILNIHPSLLPKYGGKGWYGMRVHRAVIKNGDVESGCTIHFVTNVYDEGPIIAQSRVPVSPDDSPETLAEKVKRLEHILYPKVIRHILSK